MCKNLRYKDLAKKVKEYGYTYSVRWHITMNVFMLTAAIGTGLLYRLHWWGISVIAVAGILSLPLLISVYYGQKYNAARFSEVDIYIHQMMYSFARTPKINQALEDTRKVVGGKMQTCVCQAITELCSDCSEKVYERALRIVEKEYENSRIETLHRFMISVEKRGGSYNNSLNVLTMDFDNWVKRVYGQQESIRRVKRNICVGIVLSFLLASASVLITGIFGTTAAFNIDITGEPVYQLVSIVFILMNLMFFVYTELSCNQNWLDSSRPDDRIMKDYKMAYHSDIRKVRRISAPIYMVIGIVAAVLAVLGFFMWAAALLAMDVYLFLVPGFNRGRAQERLRDDVYSGFSDWLRDVALNMQEEPLQLAIENSFDGCPVVLKESLEQFIYEMEQNPSDVRPYYSFMEMFGILDISATVKTLYSLSQLGEDKADETINQLIERNYQYMDKHQAEKDSDTLSMMQFTEYIPTLFVSFKIATDMLLVITNYL